MLSTVLSCVCIQCTGEVGQPCHFGVLKSGGPALGQAGVLWVDFSTQSSPGTGANHMNYYHYIK